VNNTSRPASEAPYLRIEGVEKRFSAEGPAAVDGVSIDVARGEFFALLGPSGCGKTTLLRMLAGFEKPNRGRILIDGVDMAGVAPYARPVNMMFQSYALFPHMSVAQNVGFGLRQEGVAKAEIADRVGKMLDLVKLGRLASRKPLQLSGGEKQRVALARALIKEPKLLLLDEPLTALDRKLREETRYELVRIQQRVGITFLMVTHDQEEAMSMASRIAVMSQGRVAQLGPPETVYERPDSRFVADFIGAVNLFDGAVASADGRRLTIACAEAGGTMIVEHERTLAAGTKVAVAIRPEKLAVDVEGGAGEGADNKFPGIVRDVAYRGEASTYVIELPTGKVVRATLSNVARRITSVYGGGQAVTVAWGASAGVVLER
jgi:putrescine transport system ATP-binding protein